MAAITMRSLQTSKNVHCSWQETVLPQIYRLEKENFPSSEIFDFAAELKKRNVEMVTIINDADFSRTGLPELVAYLVLSHPKFGNRVFLHKICVSDEYRKRGIAREMLRIEIERLNMRCSRIQLWVHQSNAAAMNLYTSLGFQNVSEVQEYYGPGRNGIQMALSLE